MRQSYLNYHGCKKITPGYILEFEIGLMENKLTMVMNEHLDTLYLEGRNNEVVKTLSKKISKLNHIENMKENGSNMYQFIVNGYH